MIYKYILHLFFQYTFHVIGFLVLASKVRKPEEEQIILEILEKHFKCTISLDSLFTCKRF